MFFVLFLIFSFYLISGLSAGAAAGGEDFLGRTVLPHRPLALGAVARAVPMDVEEGGSDGENDELAAAFRRLPIASPQRSPLRPSCISVQPRGLEKSEKAKVLAILAQRLGEEARAAHPFQPAKRLGEEAGAEGMQPSQPAKRSASNAENRAPDEPARGGHDQPLASMGEEE